MGTQYLVNTWKENALYPPNLFAFSDFGEGVGY